MGLYRHVLWVFLGPLCKFSCTLFYPHAMSKLCLVALMLRPRFDTSVSIADSILCLLLYSQYISTNLDSSPCLYRVPIRNREEHFFSCHHNGLSKRAQWCTHGTRWNSKFFWNTLIFIPAVYTTFISFNHWCTWCTFH